MYVSDGDHFTPYTYKGKQMCSSKHMTDMLRLLVWELDNVDKFWTEILRLFDSLEQTS